VKEKKDFDRIVEEALHGFYEGLPIEYEISDKDTKIFDSFFEKMIPVISTQIKKERTELLPDGHEARVIKISDHKPGDGSRK
jgi:hypothetical protein